MGLLRNGIVGEWDCGGAGLLRNGDEILQEKRSALLNNFNLCNECDDLSSPRSVPFSSPFLPKSVPVYHLCTVQALRGGFGNVGATIVTIHEVEETYHFPRHCAPSPSLHFTSALLKH